MATWDNEKEMENIERLEDEERLWAEGLTKAQVDLRARREARAAEEAAMTLKIAAFRAKYPESTTSDYGVRALIMMAEGVGREP